MDDRRSSAAWEAVNDIVFACLDRPPGEREAALEAACGARPELADRIRSAWEKLRALDLLDDDGPREGEQCFGDFRIIGRIGRGGTGMVDLAEQIALGRRVALKRIRDDRFVSDGARARFLRECRIAARLAHPNLCPVFEAGEHDGVPYLVMPFLAGEPMDAWIRRTSEASASATAAERRRIVDRTIQMLEDLANGLHSAHESGLVHRDVKPGNVLITADGTPILLDFGLARGEDDDLETLTRTGAQLGTVPYMAPEQLDGGDVDRRTDVYALGITLFEALTGRLPFAEAHAADLPAAIRRGVGTSVRSEVREVPPELEVVLAKAVDPDPGQRYETAAALAEDLRRIRAHEPILARRLGPTLRARRWAQRNPVASAVIVLLTVGLVVVSTLLLRMTELAREARASAARLEARVLGSVDDVAALRKAFAACELDPADDDNLAELYQAAKDCREIAQEHFQGPIGAVAVGGDGSRAFVASSSGHVRLYGLAGEAGARGGQVLPEELARADLLAAPGSVSTHLLAVSPDASAVFVAGEVRGDDGRPRGWARIWIPDAGSVGPGTVREVLGIPRYVVGAEWLDAGTLVVADLGSIRVVEGADGGDPRVVSERRLGVEGVGDGLEIFGFEILRDGTGIVWTKNRSSPAWEIRVWRIARFPGGEARQIARYPALRRDPRGCVVHEDADRILVPACSFEGDDASDSWLDAHLLELSTGRTVAEDVGIPERSFFALDFTPDGAFVVLGGGRGKVWLHRASDGSPFDALRARERVVRVRCTPDGRYLVAGGDEGATDVFDLATRLPAFTLDGLHDADTSNYAVAAGGRLLLGGDYGGRLRFWSLAGDHAGASRRPPYPVGFPQVVDGTVYAANEGVVAWPVLEGAEPSVLASGLPDAAHLHATADGASLLVGASGGFVVVDRRSGDLVYRSPALGSGNVSCVRMHPDGRRFVYALNYSRDCPRGVGVLDPEGGRTVFSTHPRGAIVNAFEIVAEDLVVVGDTVGSIRTWELADAASEDGDAAAPGTPDPVPAVERARLQVLDGPASTPVSRLAWDPAARRLAVGTRDGVCLLVDVGADGSLRETHRLHGHGKFVSWLSFSPDGRYLASAGFDDTWRIWDVASGRERFRLDAESQALGVAWLSADPDDLHFVTTEVGGWMHEVRLGRGLIERVRARLGRLGVPARD